MTGLHRTPLTTSQKVECAAMALVGQDIHGTVSALSEQFNISRPTLYEARHTASDALYTHFEKGESAHRVVSVAVDEAHLRRAVVSMRVVGVNSIRAIEGLIPVLFPGVRASYGKIQQMLCEAEEQAAQFNRTMDLSGVSAGALDEMFSQGEPVLAGVDLDSGLLFSLELCERRDAQTWAGVLNQGRSQGLALSVVVKDAAKGIAAGVSEVFPQAEQRDDCFHALYESNKVRRTLERRAYGAIERETQALGALGKIRCCEPQRRRAAKRALSTAARECTEAVKRFDVFDAAMHTLRGAIECVDIDSAQLHRPEQVQALIEQVADTLDTLDVRECPKLAKYLRNRAPGLALAQASLLPKLEALGQRYSLEAVSVGCVVLYLVGALRKRPHRARHRELYRQLIGAYAQLRASLGAECTNALLDDIEQLLVQRHRASSAIEGFNAALRPFLYVHKGVTQGFLELFRAYYNLRTRRWGRHKGTSALATLTGQPVEDWLSELGFAPSLAVH
jgi:hypothetical protein